MFGVVVPDVHFTGGGGAEVVNSFAVDVVEDLPRTFSLKVKELETRFGVAI